MSVNIAGGLREGHDGEHVVQFVRDGEPVDLTNYTVTCQASFDGGTTTFNPTVSSYEVINGKVKITCLAADLDQAGDLACEFDFAPIGGADPLNPNARPVIITVRALFQEAA